MRTKLFRKTAVLLTVISIIVLSAGISADAARSGTGELYTNAETGFRVWIMDDEDLLSEQGERNLLEEMIPITEYGDVIFWSTDAPSMNEIEQAKDERYMLCQNESSCILVINTDRRKVTFQSDGAINRVVNASLARSITDNASGQASSGDYYACASEVYSEVLTLLRGGVIAEPMRVVSMIVLGLMLSFVLVVSVVFGTRLNPLIKRNKDQVILKGEGMLYVGTPIAHKTGATHRGWVTAGQVVLEIVLEVLFSSIGSGGGGSGGGSGGGGSLGGGGGSGGSSSY